MTRQNTLAKGQWGRDLFEMRTPFDLTEVHNVISGISFPSFAYSLF